MAEVKKMSMRDQCYSIIKEKILRQEYDLGEFINIVELSSELSVSNTPIREALTLLEADGLVVSTLNTKSQVILFTRESFKEMTQTIHILVKGAYDLCVKENRIEPLCTLLENSLTAQEQSFHRGDYYQFTHETVDFDRCMFEALGNSQLLLVFDNLASVLFLMYRTNHQRHDAERLNSVSEHRRILDVIRSRRHSEVDRLLDEHYNKA